MRPRLLVLFGVASEPSSLKAPTPHPVRSARLSVLISLVGLLCAVVTASTLATTLIPGGNLNGNLSLSGSPYVVTGPVTVTTSLSVDASVVVRFRNNTYIQVSGTLTTLGSSGHSVVFTSDADTVGGHPAAGNWYGVLGNNGTFSLSYTNINYAGEAGNGGLTGSVSALSWSGGGVSSSSSDGIRISGTSATLTGLTGGPAVPRRQGTSCPPVLCGKRG